MRTTLCLPLLLAYLSSSCIQTIQTASMIPLNFLQHKNIGETEISPIFSYQKGSTTKITRIATTSAGIEYTIKNPNEANFTVLFGAMKIFTQESAKPIKEMKSSAIVALRSNKNIPMTPAKKEVPEVA